MPQSISRLLAWMTSPTEGSAAFGDWVAGHETGHEHPDGSPLVAPGNLSIFSNVADNRWVARELGPLASGARRT